MISVEFLIAMIGAASGGETVTEHDVTLLMPGDVDSVKARLSAALERLGYLVLNENPLQAKRRSRGWGKASANALDYPRNLTVFLKSAGEGATLATFDYTVHDAWLPPGSKQTLTREAEALVALATQEMKATRCATCGTTSDGESRFCRQCGTLLSTSEPAEMEVLRMTALARAAQYGITTGFILLAVFCIALFMLPYLDMTPTEKELYYIFFVGPTGILAWLMTLFGMRRLFSSLKRESQPPASQQAGAPQPTSRIALQEEPPSITESTTDLLESNEEASPASVKSRGRETA